MAEYVDREALRSGRILLELSNAFVQNGCRETLLPLLSCLRDSMVWIPMKMTVSERDQERLLKIKEGQQWKNKDEVQVEPNILRSPDGKLWLPIFSQESQIPAEYKKDFSMAEWPMLQCLEMAHRAENLEGIVLDPFTEHNVTMPFFIVDMVREMPSRIAPEEETRS